MPARAAPRGVDADDTLARVNGDHTLIQRIEQRGQQGVFCFERSEPRAELFAEAVEGDREVTDLAGRREGRPQAEISGCEPAGHIAQLDDRLRHRAREEDGHGHRDGECEASTRDTMSCLAWLTSTAMLAPGPANGDVEAVVNDEDHTHDDQAHDNERAEEEPLGESHSGRAGAGPGWPPTGRG